MPAVSIAPQVGDFTALDDAVQRMRADRRFDGVLLFGSVARGEAGERSDVDLIAVHHGAVPDDILGELSPRISVGFYTPQRLAELPARCPLFANHLAREGVVFHDRSGSLSDVLRQVSPIDAASADRLAALTERRLADVLGDPSFGPADRLSAAELYALSKQSALLESARAGLYEFNRHRAMRWLGEATPQLSADIENVAALEGAWLSNRRTPSPSAPVTLSDAIVNSVVRILRSVRDR